MIIINMGKFFVLFRLPAINLLFAKNQAKLVKLFCVAALCLAAPILTFAGETTAKLSNELELGRRIYTEGMLPSGAVLTGNRFGNTQTNGSAAACVNCHRPSGMGEVEGDIQVPPIAGNFLFMPNGERQLATMDPRVSKSFNQAHDPYNDATLATAIVNGVNNLGRQMNVAMPRYSMNASDLKVLTAYLKQLSTQISPGVTNHSIRFATVITPDVDPGRRKVMIDMMKTIVLQKNASTLTGMKGHTRHHMTSAAEMVLGTERKWELDIWELHGPSELWADQLNTFNRNQPVFALISGLSNGSWQPVHDFCSREQVPCWFPSVDLPGKKMSPYSLYFSGGITLEADVLARYLLSQKVVPKRVVQIYHDNEIGRAASTALVKALEGSVVAVDDHILTADVYNNYALKKVLTNIDPNDVIMFWLPAADMAAVTKFNDVVGDSYFSSVLAKDEIYALTDNWKKNARIVYPYELPENRNINLAYFHAWLNLRKLPLVDEVMQSEVFFAMNFMTDTLSEMLNNLYRDYLIERAETMLSKRESSKVEQETRDRFALGSPGDIENKHGPLTADASVRLKLHSQLSSDYKSQGTTVYPHLSMGIDQRYASKGGYVVKFANGTGNKLIADSAWIVP